MTAIASIYTPEGFVIGADGRQLTMEMDSIESDSVRKIFGFSSSNVRGAYAWTGATRLAWGSSVFEFKDSSFEVIPELERTTFNSLADYAVQFGLSVYDRLKSWIDNADAQFGDLCNPEMTKVRLIGFEGGKPAMTAAYFPLENGDWTCPGLGVGNPPINDLNVFTGLGTC
jgi:hypothetical protein